MATEYFPEGTDSHVTCPPDLGRAPMLPSVSETRSAVQIEHRWMRILDFLREDGIICPLEAGSKNEVLEELVEPIAKANPLVDKGRLLKTLLERENLGSTGIGGGIAIPHGKLDGLDCLVASFGKSAKGINFHSMDDKPAYIFFLLVAPKNSAADHLKALARISRLLKDPLLLNAIQKADTAEEIFRVLEDYDVRCP
jgi:nitrogen PTS system EIIA component